MYSIYLEGTHYKSRYYKRSRKYGYIDDIFITTYVIRLLADVYGYEFLENYWESEDDFEDVVELCYERSKDVLREKTTDVLNYVGLI